MPNRQELQITLSIVMIFLLVATVCLQAFSCQGTDDFQYGFGAPSNATGRSATFLVAASDAGTLSRLQADYLCDGTADEEQINAAIAALLSGGGKIGLSSGTFNLAASLVLPDRANIDIHLDGQGQGVTNLKLASGANCDIIKKNSTTALGRNVTISNMTLDGNNSYNTLGKGINGTGLCGVWIDNVRIQATAEAGLYADGATQTTTGWWVDFLRVYACGLPGTPANNIHLTGNANNFNFISPYSDFATQDGYYIYGCTEIKFYGVAADQNDRYGVRLESSARCGFYSGYIGGNKDHGFLLTNGSEECYIQDINFYDNGYEDTTNKFDIYMTSSGTVNDCIITGNIFQETHGSMRIGGDVNRNIITGNNFYNVGTGSKVAGTITGTGNRISGNAGYNTEHWGTVTVSTGTITFTPDVTFSGSVTASAFYGDGSNLTGIASGSLTAEEAEDIVGAMVSGNTESGIAVTYNDTFDNLDFAVNVSGSGARTATIVLAGANSTAREQASADYLADGTDDDVELAAAITAAAGGKLWICSGSYQITSDIDFIDVDVQGSGRLGEADYYVSDLGGTILHASSTGTENFQIHNRTTVSDLWFLAPAAYSGTLVTVGGQNEQIWGTVIMDNVGIITDGNYGPSGGTPTAGNCGLWLYPDYTSNYSSIAKSFIKNSSIRGFHYGLYATTDNAGNSFINGNKIELNSDYCTYPATFNPAAGGEINNNTFWISMEPVKHGKVTQCGVTLVGSPTARNYFALDFWDWNKYAGNDKATIYEDPNNDYNVYQGELYTYTSTTLSGSYTKWLDDGGWEQKWYMTDSAIYASSYN